ncbi:hypothetical protein QWY87_16790 [Lutimonas halocynthiae]|uniref:hypothetical protein n=1 Tax=Lutimonas halocynthiae TaxID=1446477 RepID=UPI0025B324E1|nr:hypothetical protein [Lutimonas halocynthiae]MDN3644374.1 hypothetical protein [Lutimonas halocynthiae]
MKKYNRLLSFLVFVLLSVNSLAQKEEVSKDLLLSTLNSVAHLKLDAGQETQLMDYNKGFVDKVYSILDGDQEDKDKKKALKDLNSVRVKDLRGMIGKHKTNKYLKLMEDELKPLAKRDHRLKEIAKS